MKNYMMKISVGLLAAAHIYSCSSLQKATAYMQECEKLMEDAAKEIGVPSCDIVFTPDGETATTRAALKILDRALVHEIPVEMHYRRGWNTITGIEQTQNYQDVFSELQSKKAKEAAGDDNILTPEESMNYIKNKLRAPTGRRSRGR